MILSCFKGVLVTDRQIDRLTDERTLVVVESLSRLKYEICTCDVFLSQDLNGIVS